MSERMQQVLLDLSTFFDPSPTVIFRRILAAIVAVYGDTMAMVNLVEGDVVRFHAVANPRPRVRVGGTLTIRHTY